nr:hypothetical protein [Paracoccus saliphilus]
MSVEICRVEELMAALELATDSLQRGESTVEVLAYDATMGIVNALKVQVVKARDTLEALFPEAA